MTAQGWRSMKSAPTDGTIVWIAWQDSIGVWATDGHYYDGKWYVFDSKVAADPHAWHPIPRPPFRGTPLED